MFVSSKNLNKVIQVALVQITYQVADICTDAGTIEMATIQINWYGSVPPETVMLIEPLS